MTPITPTVGRKVWYYSHGAQAEPIDATVIKVHASDDGSTGPTSPVNLNVIDPDTGMAIFRPNIVFHDESEGWQGEHYRWMPYQAASAAKAAAETPAPSGMTSGGIAPASTEQPIDTTTTETQTV